MLLLFDVRVVQVIFKSGDDLRQDQVVIQVQLSLIDSLCLLEHRESIAAVAADG